VKLAFQIQVATLDEETCPYKENDQNTVVFGTAAVRVSALDVAPTQQGGSELNIRTASTRV
jgi:hypothetical protein